MLQFSRGRRIVYIKEAGPEPAVSTSADLRCRRSMVTMDEEGGVSMDDEALPTYCVTRPSFNEQRLQDELLHRRQGEETSIKHRLAQRLRYCPNPNLLLMT